MLVKEGTSVHSGFKASMSVEGSLVFPLFLFFMITIMSSLIMVKEQSVKYSELHGKVLSEYESTAGNSPGNEIREDITYEQHPVTDFFPFISVTVNDGIYMHPFTGYTGDGTGTFDQQEEEWVYVTKTGIKYHRSPDCSYINIRPSAVDSGYALSSKNTYGRKYRACDVCHPGKTGMLFVTSDGECYHCRSDCPGLKRTVFMKTLREAEADGYTPCSKCG
ncbi:MAG: hypothetical protein K6A38_05545 [Lachnospiraceae bacterium]|nr:hypothetical protein [Lachnospiraceae bacterium]